MPTFRTFGPFRIDISAEILFRGVEPLPVGRRGVALLRALLERPGVPVSKEALMEAAWPGLAVEESNLTVQIASLRRVLGKEPGGERWIETLSRRGYRFVGPIPTEESANAPASRPSLTPDLTLPDKPAMSKVTMVERTAIDILTERPAGDLFDPPHSPATVPSFTSERRQLTVLSCELVPTELSSRMELEDLRDTIETHMQCVAQTVARFAGRIAKRIGNVVLVNFGYPVAHEDDAEQAVRMGLELSNLTKAVGSHSGSIWQPRIGIATGEVIISSSAGGEGTAGEVLVGEAPTRSTCLQACARPGTVIVDKTTKSLVGDLFESQELDPVEDARLSQAVQVWQVHADRIVESRFAALHSGILTPLVGREEEIELLHRRWVQTTAGEARVVLIAGEAGIGKSRMVAALEDRIQSERYARFHYSCSPRHSDSALHPIIVQLEHSAGFARGDAPEEKFAKLSALLERTQASPEDVALLADLLAVASTGQQPPVSLSSQRKKEKTEEALTRQITTAARLRPVLVIFEDTHWIDPSSLDALSVMIDRLRMSPALVLVTFRSEFRPPWIGQPNVTMLSLSRLGRREGELLVRHVAGHKFLSDEIVGAIAQRTDGVPLFAEEVTKAVLEDNESPALNVSTSSLRGTPLVPTTLQASLMARLDRLGSSRQIAEIGATIGREFPYDLLAIVSGRSERELQSAVDRIVESGLVFRRGVIPGAVFIFKHALIQDIAYGALPRERRRQLHARIAKALQEEFAEIAAGQPEILGHHFEQAGKFASAVEYWIKAGDLAGRRSASREAAVHYRTALGDLERQPSSAKADELESEISMKLGNALMQSEGYGSAAAIEAYRRAQTRAAALDQAEDYARATSGLAPLLFSSCHYQEVVNTIDEILDKRNQRLRQHTRIHLRTMLGVANYGLGRFIDAWDQFDAARILDRDSPCTHDNPIGGGDPAIVIRNYMGMTGSVLGKFAESLALTEEGLVLARGRGDAFTLAWALLSRARALRTVGRFTDGMPHVNEAVDLCERHGFRARLGTALVARGTLLFGLGDSECGIQDMYLGTGMWRETSGTFHMSEWLSYLVDQLWRLDRLDEAATVLREAEKIADGTEEKSHLGELRRLRGNLLYRSGAIAGAKSQLAQAIKWSRDREAKVFELRATRDLARIHVRTGKKDAASKLLRHGVSLFSDQLEFPDLYEVYELLHHL
jgi:DNA-binding winged helix-turn-helix (wHTH) protein/tetratricopeptide (TPR) repeat protein